MRFLRLPQPTLVTALSPNEVVAALRPRIRRVPWRFTNAIHWKRPPELHFVGTSTESTFCIRRDVLFPRAVFRCLVRGRVEASASGGSNVHLRCTPDLRSAIAQMLTAAGTVMPLVWWLGTPASLLLLGFSAFFATFLVAIRWAVWSDAEKVVQMLGETLQPSSASTTPSPKPR